jgi:hypothetical protein
MAWVTCQACDIFAPQFPVMEISYLAGEIVCQAEKNPASFLCHTSSHLHHLLVIRPCKMRPNARCQPRLAAGAQWTLEGVGCTPSLGRDVWQTL